jgi:membrane protease subunit HflK
MPWSNNGGWQGGQGPWGSRPPGRGGGGGGPQPPDLEELLRKTQERARQLFPGGGRGGGVSVRTIALGAVALAVVWGLSGIYRVLPEEKGVELVFGRLYEITDPGLRIAFPWPIGTVLKPQVTRVNRVEVGFRSGGTNPTTGRPVSARDVNEESLMLTGDENIVDINFVVFWRIQDPAAFLFNIRDPENTVKAAAESTMREIVGQTPIVEATTEGRRAIELRAREQLQLLMNDYGAGISIDEVQLQKADPPQEVIDAFRDVQRAQADRERAQNEAEAFANDIIPRARGEAERLLQEAQAYRQEVVARAQGEAQRFLAILEQYNNAQDVTKRRIYLETMEQVLTGMSKVLIEQPAQGGQNVLPYLPLPALQGTTSSRRPETSSNFGAPPAESVSPAVGSQ